MTGVGLAVGLARTVIRNPETVGWTAVAVLGLTIAAVAGTVLWHDWRRHRRDRDR